MNKPISIFLIIGTRPEIIRFTNIIKLLDNNPNYDLHIIHTGQHYSYEMDKIFFKELTLPQPQYNLNTGSLSQPAQIAHIISQLEPLIQQHQPKIVIVWGDTNSSLAASITANKLNIPVAHIEAGYRSFDLRMSEETNRVLIDHAATLLFPFCSQSMHHLKKEHASGKIISIRNPLFDVFHDQSKHIQHTDSNHILVTLHRAENVDNPQTLKNILEAIALNNQYRFILPLHPRTKKNIDTYKLTHLLHEDHITIIEPVGYHEMLGLIINAQKIITDSGGLQVEAYVAQKPCITLRKSTEWLLTVKSHANTLIDPEKPNLTKKITKCLKQPAPHPFPSADYGTGNGSQQCIQELDRYFNIT